MDSLFESLEKVLDERYHHLIPSNIKAIEIGAKYVRSFLSSFSLREDIGLRLRFRFWKDKGGVYERIPEGPWKNKKNLKRSALENGSRS
jgi:hypothetical protein